LRTRRHFDSTRKLIFSSNGIHGTISVIREVDANTFISTAPLTPKPWPEQCASICAAAGFTSLPPISMRMRRPELLDRPHAVPHLVPGSVKLLILDPAR
jgi:hypothetical protein